MNLLSAIDEICTTEKEKPENQDEYSFTQGWLYCHDCKSWYNWKKNQPHCTGRKKHD